MHIFLKPNMPVQYDVFMHLFLFSLSLSIHISFAHHAGATKCMRTCFGVKGRCDVSLCEP